MNVLMSQGLRHALIQHFLQKEQTAMGNVICPAKGNENQERKKLLHRFIRSRMNAD